MADERDAPQDDAKPDAAVGNAAAGVDSGDAEIADTVDEAVVTSITSDYVSPQPEGIDGDPIGEAEDHIASLDMAAERKKAAELMKKL